MSLQGFQRRFLRGQAHGLKPLVQVGKHGLSDGLTESFREALDHHELVKVRFMEFKEDKKELSTTLAERCDAELITILGHQALFYRQQPDPEKRKIRLPKRASS